jgi:hypothetical protein
MNPFMREYTYKPGDMKLYVYYRDEIETPYRNHILQIELNQENFEVRVTYADIKYKQCFSIIQWGYREVGPTIVSTIAYYVGRFLRSFK